LGVKRYVAPGAQKQARNLGNWTKGEIEREDHDKDKEKGDSTARQGKSLKGHGEKAALRKNSVIRGEIAEVRI